MSPNAHFATGTLVAALLDVVTALTLQAIPLLRRCFIIFAVYVVLYDTSVGKCLL